MGGVTPWLGVPYAIGTDPVSSGDNVTKAIAEAMGGTPWVYPALASGWSTGGTTSTQVGYCRDGVGNVHIQGWLGFPGVVPNGAAFTLPVGFRPFGWISGAVADTAQTDHQFGSWAVTTVGDVSGGIGVPGASNRNFMLNIVFTTRPRP